MSDILSSVFAPFSAVRRHEERQVRRGRSHAQDEDNLGGGQAGPCCLQD